MKRTLIVIAVLTAAIVVGSMAYFVSSSHQAGHVDTEKIFAAVKAYSANLRAEGLPVPASVSLRELINHRLLTASDVSGFSGIEVEINLSTDVAHPDEVLMRAHLADGREVVALADGSVHTRRNNTPQ